MRRAISSWRVLPVAGVLLLAPAAAQGAWRDVALRDSPRSAVATCLRATATPGLVGLLGPLRRYQSPYDLLSVGPSGIERAATVRLGALHDCPAVAVDPSGHGVVAGAAGDRRGGGIRAAVGAPGAGFGAPVTVGPGGPYVDGPAAAVSPRGDAVVAWVLRREPRRGQSSSRVFAALRPAGGSFGQARPLTPWRRGSDFLFVGGSGVAAAMDAAGTATVAWTQGIPDRGNIPELSTVQVATASSGGEFAPAQTLTREVQEATPPALAVAPSGAALLAHDGQGSIRLFERAAGATGFQRLAPLRSRDAEWQAPAVALGADGSAVVAWRTGNPRFGSNPGVVTIERPAGAAFSPPRIAWKGRPQSSSGSYAVIISTREGAVVPEDAGNTGLRVALQPGGRYVLAWGVDRRTPLGDRPTAVRLATGVIGGPPGSATTVGCRCRDVNGLALLQLAGGEPALAFSDNVSYVAALDGEFALRAGRLRIAADRPGPAPPAPPSVELGKPRTTTLRYDQRLRLGVRCGGPCDLRGWVVDSRGRTRGVGTASLRRAGRGRISILPRIASHLAPPRGRTRLLVRAWAPAGARYSEASASVRLRRAPLRPLAQLLSVRAVREGGAIVVTWMTDRPVRDDVFEVEPRDRRRRPLDSVLRQGEGKSSFRVRLRLSPEDDARSVAVSIVRGAPPHDRRTVVVPVSG